MSVSTDPVQTQGFAFAADVAEKLPDLLPDSIISRALAGAGPFKTSIFGFAAGQELSEHTSVRPAMLYFVEGEATVTLGDQTFEAKAGTLVAMEPNLSHGIVARTPTKMLLIQVDMAAAKRAG